MNTFVHHTACQTDHYDFWGEDTEDRQLVESVVQENELLLIDVERLRKKVDMLSSENLSLRKMSVGSSSTPSVALQTPVTTLQTPAKCTPSTSKPYERLRFMSPKRT